VSKKLHKQQGCTNAGAQKADSNAAQLQWTMHSAGLCTPLEVGNDGMHHQKRAHASPSVQGGTVVQCGAHSVDTKPHIKQSPHNFHAHRRAIS
jgi:hypothetical protein